jgi:hypothetical protein
LTAKVTADAHEKGDDEQYVGIENKALVSAEGGGDYQH